jgi:guanylate kinase
MEVKYDQRQYYEEVHRVTVKRAQGEPLGLTVKVEGECVVVSRILDGGLIDRTGQIDLGDIVVEVGGTPIQTVDDLMYQVAQSGTKITFLVKKTPPEDLKKLAISQTPSLRKAMNQNANPEQKVLCYVKALFNYDPKEDNIHPCAEIGLMFFTGDILAIVNQDDPNWWQARLAECPGPSGLIPSRELEERRKAYVDKEADYTTKIGLCGTFTAKKKKKNIYKSRGNTEFDRAELSLYEEVVKLPPFKRKSLILIGANGVGRRTLKSKLLDRNPDRFASPLPHTSRPKRNEEDNGFRYWFVDREDLEISVRRHEMLEYGEHGGELYGTKLDSVREVIDTGRMCVLDCSPAALKLLHNSNEFMPFVVFLAAPGLEDMKHIYDNGKMAGAIMASQRSLTNFERNSSIRHSSRRGRTLESLSSLYVEEDVVKNLEESAKLQRAYANYFDLIVVNESWEDTYMKIMNALDDVEHEASWVPAKWVYS